MSLNSEVRRLGKERLKINLPSNHTEAERRVCRRHTAACHLLLGALECSLDTPSERRGNKTKGEL